eukprot:3986664-Amphidinium_carterae.1
MHLNTPVSSKTSKWKNRSTVIVGCALSCCARAPCTCSVLQVTRDLERERVGIRRIYNICNDALLSYGEHYGVDFSISGSMLSMFFLEHETLDSLTAWIPQASS